jgi:hypothetical protein
MPPGSRASPSHVICTSAVMLSWKSFATLNSWLSWHPPLYLAELAKDSFLSVVSLQYFSFLRPTSRIPFIYLYKGMHELGSGPAP